MNKIIEIDGPSVAFFTSTNWEGIVESRSYIKFGLISSDVDKLVRSIDNTISAIRDSIRHTNNPIIYWRQRPSVNMECYENGIPTGRYSCTFRLQTSPSLPKNFSTFYSYAPEGSELREPPLFSGDWGNVSHD